MTIEMREALKHMYSIATYDWSFINEENSAGRMKFSANPNALRVMQVIDCGS
jgi:hypothetical protein